MCKMAERSSIERDFHETPNMYPNLCGNISNELWVGIIGIMSASCSLAFSITTRFVKKFLKTIRNKKKKQ